MKLRILRSSLAWFAICFAPGLDLAAQNTEQFVRPALEKPLLPHDVLVYQLRQYLLGRIAEAPHPRSAAEWTAQSERIRAELLERIFHGWPKEWVDAAPRFEETGAIETGHGYRIRKFRYHVVPGFQADALLYEPESVHGRAPGILNVLGHDLTAGKSAEYMQKICINFAKQQMVALSLEFIGTGELNTPGNEHTFGGALNLVGLQDDGLFYLAMRRGLDYLASLPNVDAGRLGVTGLSGGGWQTITLSALDERVAAAVPVAGYSSLAQRVEELEELTSIGDLEQVSSGVYEGYDYSHLTALRAPRPTLLIYNANDDCCFRAALSKPLVFEKIKPVFTLYGKADALNWHVNEYPGTHNYQRDNREHAYRFFGRFLRNPMKDEELPSDGEIHGYDELAVGLPADNLTLLSLARKAASRLPRTEIPAEGAAREEWEKRKRGELRSVLRYKPVELKRAWHLDTGHGNGIDSLSYLFEMRDGLALSGVWQRATGTADSAPATLLLDDRGRGMSFADVAERLDRGEQVLAANLLFTDEKAMTKRADSRDSHASATADLAAYAMVFDTLGDRTLGIETAQVVELAKWLRTRSDRRTIRIEARGIRSQTVALLAAALEPTLFSEVAVRQGMSSFAYLLDAGIRYEDAPELFCLDLYKEFDVNELEALAGRPRIVHRDALPAPTRSGHD